MNVQQMKESGERAIAAWNTQDPEKVVAVYTEDVVYRDPNTRGQVTGRENFRRYLTKLFSRWEMEWSIKESFLFEDGEGCSALWRVRFRLPGGEETVEAHGMDLIVMEGDRIKRNEVYFDRAVLAPLMNLTFS